MAVPLSGREWLGWIWVWCILVFSLPYFICAALLRKRDGVSSFKLEVANRTLKTFMGNLSIRQLQRLIPSTPESYATFVKKNHLPSQIVDIGGGTHGYWIGDRSATTVIFWLHGGGYAISALEAHYEIILDIVNRARSRKASVSGFLLQYDLTLTKSYPTQLRQAAAALKYLTQNQNIPGSRIILCGDSAGGNLGLALMSHLMHGHPDVEPLTLNGELGGLMLVSPWVTFAQTSQSMITNEKKDLLPRVGLKIWSDAYLNGAHEEPFNTPLQPAVDWWMKMPVQRICILGGRNEVFIDDILEFADKLKKYNSTKVEVFVGEGEVHDQPLADKMAQVPPSKQAEKIHQWIMSCCL